MKLATLFQLMFGICAGLDAWATDCKPAEAQLEARPFKRWNDSYAYYRRYQGRCADGALREALDWRHTQLLARTAPKLDALRAISGMDPGYETWLLLGVFYDPEESDAAGPKTACGLLDRLQRCQPRNRAMCAKLASRVGPSPGYTRTCHPARAS